MPKLGSGFPDTEYTYERNALMGGLTTRRALELPGSSDPGRMAVFGGNRARQGRAVEAILQEAGPDTPIAYLDDD
jgi:hypothetical protein